MAVAWMRNGLGLYRGVDRHTLKLAGTDGFCLRGNRNGLGQQSRSWREFDVCIPYAAISANKRQIQKRHEKFIVARGSRDSDIWSGACKNGSQMSKSNH
jgi:hypothetical protein